MQARAPCGRELAGCRWQGGHFGRRPSFPAALCGTRFRAEQLGPPASWLLPGRSPGCSRAPRSGLRVGTPSGSAPAQLLPRAPVVPLAAASRRRARSAGAARGRPGPPSRLPGRCCWPRLRLGTAAARLAVGTWSQLPGRCCWAAGFWPVAAAGSGAAAAAAAAVAGSTRSRRCQPALSPARSRPEPAAGRLSLDRGRAGPGCGGSTAPEGGSPFRGCKWVSG
jgi:hypothetical protein